jgi:hypothetical protein
MNEPDGYRDWGTGWEDWGVSVSSEDSDIGR